MPSVLSEVSSAPPPKVMWLIIALGAILASTIATLLSLAFLARLSGSRVFIYFVGIILNQGHVNTRVTIDFLDQAGVFLLAASLSGLLAGLLLWWLALLRPRHTTVGRGALLGMWSAILAHPVMWGIWILIYPWEVVPLRETLLAQGVNWLSGVVCFSVWSLVGVGWITLLVGGFTGALLIAFQRALTARSQKFSSGGRF